MNGARRTVAAPAPSTSATTTKVVNSTPQQRSEDQWLADMAFLLRNAKEFFSDVSWSADDGTLVHAHKAVVFARASGAFQQQYLVASASRNDLHGSTGPDDSMISLPYRDSQRSVTPSAASHDYADPSPYLRPASPASMLTIPAAGSFPSTPAPLSLGGTDVTIFRSLLEHFYTSTNTAESFAILFEGFEEGVREGEPELKGVEKLRADLLYSWRSKLYTDMSLSLDGNSASVFATHRAILAARSPFFRSLLKGNYSDSNRTLFTLPSPPFTPSSTTFILGYCYTGTLDFGNRTFDLTTAFEIWRGAAYLQISLLQVEVEDKIEAMLNLARAARVFGFALAPDVNSQRLRRSAEPFVVTHFSDTWNCPQIGNLDYDSQRKLVGAVCDSINPGTLATIGKGSFSLRKGLELEKANWSTHIRSMLDAIDDRIKSQLGKSVPEVVVTPAFVSLVDGLGFSTDVLEWLVSDLMVGSLTEAKAPDTYQALVGLVLLREEGILMDAKVIIEDARNGILKYIKRRWMGIVSASGFDKLESWCLKELSDELEVPVEDLLTPMPRSASSSSRLISRSVPKRQVFEAPTTASTAPRRIAAVTPGTTSSSIAARTPTRAIRTSTSSATSAVSIATRAPLVRSNAAAAARLAANRPGATVTRAGGGVTPPVRSAVLGSPVTRPVRPTAHSTPSNSKRPGSRAADSASSAEASSSLSAPTPTRNAAEPPTVPTSPPDLSQPLPATLMPASSSESAILNTSSSTTFAQSINGTTSSSSTPRAAATSSASLATSRPAARPLARSNPSASTSSIMRSPNVSTPPSSGSRAARTSTAAPSVPSTMKGKLPTPTPSSPAVAHSDARVRKSSTASSKAESNQRPSSIHSTRSASSARTIPTTTTSTPTGTVRRPNSSNSLRAVTPKVSVRPVPGGKLSSSTTPKLGKPFPPPTPPVPSSVEAVSHPGPPASESEEVSGTTLLSGIPCIVTVATDRPSRFRASVRYIGGVVAEQGQWIGIEVAESAIPDEAQGLPWHEGEVAGKRYFDIKPATDTTKAGSSGRGTPSAPDAVDGGRSAASSSSSLRPPSRKARRSSSSDAFESGPRRGLFVRPSQIVYVL